MISLPVVPKVAEVVLSTPTAYVKLPPGSGVEAGLGTFVAVML
jgi:hypothetical protein